jgi:hypothetical protein
MDVALPFAFTGHQCDAAVGTINVLATLVVVHAEMTTYANMHMLASTWPLYTAPCMSKATLVQQMFQATTLAVIAANSIITESAKPEPKTPDMRFGYWDGVPYYA